MQDYLSLLESTDLSDSLLEESSDALTQAAVSFCILDPRPFAPPLESPQYRLIYLRLSSELKLGLDPGLVEELIQHGFKSLTLLSLMSEKHLRILGRILRLRPEVIEALRNSLKMLNEAPLEPLYSHKKYIIKRRKEKHSLRQDGGPKYLLDALHIDEPSARPRREPCASPSFPSFSSSKSSSSKSSDETNSISSQLSSLSSQAGSNLNLPPPLLGYCPLIFCPRHSNPLEFPRLFKHILSVHNPYRARLKKEPLGGNSSIPRSTGSVELEFSFGDALRVKPDSLLWFGPTEFLFDGVPFYEIVYRISSSKRKKDSGGSSSSHYLFWLFAGADTSTARGYSYVISLYKDKEPRNAASQRRFVTSFEENPLSLFTRSGKGGRSSSAYFTFEESKLKSIALANGTLKYVVKVYKNRGGNNGSSNSGGQFGSTVFMGGSGSNHQSKRRHNFKY